MTTHGGFWAYLAPHKSAPAVPARGLRCGGSIRILNHTTEGSAEIIPCAYNRPSLVRDIVVKVIFVRREKMIRVLKQLIKKLAAFRVQR